MSVSTVRQMKLGHELAKDLKANRKPRNKTQLMVDAGYSEKTAEGSTAVIFKQPGTINAINVALEQAGFDSNNAKRVVAEIMNKSSAEDKDRINAAKLVFEVNGDFAPDKSISLNLNTEDLKKAIVEDMTRFRGNTT